MSDALRAAALDYLARRHVMTLATIGPEGPWAAAVFYANDGFDLYFLSAATTRHGRNLAADPRVAVTIQEDHRDWPEIRGVQLEGTVVPVPGPDLDRVRALYGAKFPVVGNAAAAPPAILAALARVRWYRVAPRALYYVDNAVAFGHREEVPLPG
jgi:uncharacterized protein